MRFLSIPPGHVERLAVPGSSFDAAHVFEKSHIDAINAALGAGRPLLVRGEPGIGKSQLARAAAKVLGRAYLPFVTDSRSESRELLWSFDAVARLADAQARGAGECPLPVGNYLAPGVLWWAFDWISAKEQAGLAKMPSPEPDETLWRNGAVVLIDEIDKADTDVPNGLLEALGSGQFGVRDRVDPVRIKDKMSPLVVISTNEERVLPDAFIRRCLVLHLSLPVEEAPTIRHLEKVGHAHFGEDLAQGILKKAAELVAGERKLARERHWRPLPGQAEYIDLLRSILVQGGRDNADRHQELLDVVAEYVLVKHPDAAEHWARRQRS